MTRLWLVLAVLFAGLLLWRRLASRATREVLRQRPPEQEVILHLNLAASDEQEARESLREIDEALSRALLETGLADIEDPFADGRRCVYTLFGKDADRVADAVRAALPARLLAPGSHAVKRYGRAGAPEELEQLS